MPPRNNAPTQELMQKLRARFAAPAFAFLTEVGSETGNNISGWCDALAMSLYPSRGLELIGFEIKVSRGDWLRELKSPAKLENFVGFCDRWYLVVGAKDIVLDGELPPPWGLMVSTRGGLRIKVKAPKLEAKTIDRVFLAALLRKVNEQTVDEELLKEAQERGEKEGRCWASVKKEELSGELANLRAKIQKFEAASGVKITDTWQSGQRIGHAVKQVLEGTSHERILADIRARAQRVVETIDGETG